jgi:hypothetical protein
MSIIYGGPLLCWGWLMGVCLGCFLLRLLRCSGWVSKQSMFHPNHPFNTFSTAHFSENWGYMSLSPVLGGNLFSVAFGRILDAHAPTSHLLSSTDAQCLQGRRCYIDALYMTIVACIVALILGVWAGWRERRKLSERASAVGRKDDAWRYGRV